MKKQQYLGGRISELESQLSRQAASGFGAAGAERSSGMGICNQQLT